MIPFLGRFFVRTSVIVLLPFMVAVAYLWVTVVTSWEIAAEWVLDFAEYVSDDED